jgi:uncharacterized protein YgiM (DUF1202 family)
MKRNRKSLVIISCTMLAFALLFGACIPTPAPPPPPPLNLAATVTAQALQLQGLTATALAQPIVVVITNTPDPALPAATIDPALNAAASTPTLGGVTISVSQNTNCRTGPSQQFSDVFTLSVGQTAEVIGKDTFDNYWIIKVPDGSGKTCWLWGKYATVSGDTASLAEAATPTPSGGEKPLAPVITSSNVNCYNAGGGDQDYEVRVNWTDNSTNETKFNIYTTPNNEYYSKKADAVTVDFIERLPAGTTLTVVVVAANASGESAPSVATFVCP